MDYKEAIERATEIVTELVDNESHDFRLEEIVAPNAALSGNWEITIGFLAPEKRQSIARNYLFRSLMDTEKDRMMSKAMERQYKEVTLDAETGEFMSMKSRSFA